MAGVLRITLRVTITRLAMMRMHTLSDPLCVARGILESSRTLAARIVGFRKAALWIAVPIARLYYATGGYYRSRWRTGGA